MFFFYSNFAIAITIDWFRIPSHVDARSWLTISLLPVYRMSLKLLSIGLHNAHCTHTQFQQRRIFQSEDWHFDTLISFQWKPSIWAKFYFFLVLQKEPFYLYVSLMTIPFYFSFFLLASFHEILCWNSILIHLCYFSEVHEK